MRQCSTAHGKGGMPSYIYVHEGLGTVEIWSLYEQWFNLKSKFGTIVQPDVDGESRHKSSWP